MSKVFADSTPRQVLHGTVHPLAQLKYDRGVVEDSFPMRRLLLSMARSPEKDAALKQFLLDAHTPNSAGYHQWLTPEEFGARFGATDADLQVVSEWLRVHGFTVARITKSRSMIEFSGTAATVRDALHTEIHRYEAPGKSFFANSSEISLPVEIAARIRHLAPLNNVPLKSFVESIGAASFSRASHRAAPEFTTTENGNVYYALAPEDYATQYDIAPVYNSGIDGTGVTIGIVGTTNINIAMVDAYRKLFGLPGDHTQVIIDGNDPGDGVFPNVEAFLDVESSGAVAPGATVNYYVAGGQPFQDVLALAALRAIEDNQASVLSASYGECEQELGEAGNQLWAELWEQAAAQGQTVMVSSGDTGPTTCPGAAVSSGKPGTTVEVGLSVNGLSSTPWNVSVGGTDFYYSDYATGAPSAATLWNQTNDVSLGSLKASLPEQPWSRAFGLDVMPFNYSSFSVPSVAGGGGVSSCSIWTAPSLGTRSACMAGYSKPDWQNAPGVPDDGVRDLPDVSLFAAVGENLSAWAICVDPWECSVTSGVQTQVFLVGGTSAASPAMAGIMALVNEKYGRQGQANYTLYQLARKFPSVFHDLTLGTNDVLCNVGATDCTGAPNSSDSFVASYGLYSAGAGYDLASGLGSIDVSQLLQKWGKATFTPSSTTLQVSSASIVHGSSVAVSAAVKAGSGTGTPTGSVVLTSTAPTSLPQNAALTLINGSASTDLSTLPGGTYNLAANYSGDATFAASLSAPVSITVTPESSITYLNADYTYTTPGGSVREGFFENGALLPFGSAWFFQAVPSSQSTGTGGSATGTVTFSDGSTTALLPLNVNGVATWSPQSLAIGSHLVTAQYSGDPSFGPSTSAPLNFTVVKGVPALSAVPEEAQQFSSSGQNVYPSGSDLVVHVTLRNQGSVVPPGGSVVVALGSLRQTIAITANAYLTSGLANVFATFNNVAAGIYPLTATYSGDDNWTSAVYEYPQQLTFAATQESATTTTLTLSQSSVDSSGSVAFDVNVQAAAPQANGFASSTFGFVQLYANGTYFSSFYLPAVPVDSTSSTGILLVPATELPLGMLQVVAYYTGLGSLAPSISAAVPLTVVATDFQLSATGANLAVKSGQSLNIPLALNGSYGETVPVTLSCAGSPSSSISCSVGPETVAVVGNGAAVLTINAYAPRLRCRPPVGQAGGHTPACPTNPEGPPSPIRYENAPPGNYSVLVTGVSGGITHNTKVDFVVQ